jgi:hypothetical protein
LFFVMKHSSRIFFFFVAWGVADFLAWGAAAGFFLWTGAGRVVSFSTDWEDGRCKEQRAGGMGMGGEFSFSLLLSCEACEDARALTLVNIFSQRTLPRRATGEGLGKTSWVASW